MKRFIGIDPGLAGGIAIIIKEAITLAVYVYPMPMAGKDLNVSVLSYILKSESTSAVSVAVVEKVHAMPGQGVTSMFKFGFVTGIIHGVLGTLAIPRYEVPPQTWKKRLLADTLKDKQAAIDWCNRTYPKVSLLETARCKKAHSGMADALCMAHYAMVTYDI